MPSVEAREAPLSITARWRRLDTPGQDLCRLSPTASGWRLEGRAEFRDTRGPADLAYRVDADGGWRTVSGEVRGTVGSAALHLAIERGADGRWTAASARVPALDGLIDLDLAFTPATNIFPIRRLALAVGDCIEAEAAWLNDASWTFERLAQRYDRVDRDYYRYESPAGGYRGLLRVDADGFVIEYPGLWTRAD